MMASNMLNPNSEVARGDLAQFPGHKRLRRSSPYRKDTVYFSSTVSAPSSCTIPSAPTSEFGLKKMNRRPGFSLVELLMVMAIIVALGAAVLPAITNVSDGMRLTNATQMLMDEILVARATALSRNLPVEVWFVQDGETSEYRLLRTAVIDNSERTTWVTGYKRLPAGVAMTAAGGRSNLIAVQNARTLPDLALKGVALRINPSGQCEVADESATIARTKYCSSRSSWPATLPAPSFRQTSRPCRSTRSIRASPCSVRDRARIYHSHEP